MDMKRFFLYAIAIAALALAGCGGNGGMTQIPIDDDDEVIVTGPTPEEIAAAEAETAKAKTKQTEILDSAAEMGVTDDGLGGQAARDGQPYTLMISRDADGTEVTIGDPTMLDMDEDPQFMTVPATDAPAFLAELNGFTGTMNVRTQDADDDGNVVQEVVVVRTNIKEPTPTPFVNDGENMGLYPLNANPNDADDNQSLTIAGDFVTMVAAMMFSNPTGEGTINFDGDNGATDMDEAAEVMGTLRGAEGTYRCDDAAGCSVMLEDGKVTTATGWIFTPKPGVKVDVENTDYLAYGIWLKRTTTKDGATTYDEVEAFFTANAVDPTPLNDVVNVAGSATYTGNSTGVYVKNVYAPSTSGEQEITSATSGLYSADVTLMANFGGGDIGTNKQFRIEGDVKTFVLQNGEVNDWGVKLESATFPNANIFSGMTTGDSTADKGAWNGGFYGAAPETADTEDAARVAPPSVLGEFNANFTDGAVLGGFGANKD